MIKKKHVTPGAPDPEDIALFRSAVKDAIPLPEPDHISPSAPAMPSAPVRSTLDEYDSFADTLSDAPLDREESLEAGDAPSFLRHGLSRKVLKKLRRGHWVVEAYIDLHGMNREQARESLGAFLASALHLGHRCVRIIHGKGLGSKNREPVLKSKVKLWLAHRDEVLAYCQAPDSQGGAGAMLVLLRS